MSHIVRDRLRRLILTTFCGLSLSGCDHVPDVREAASHLPPYQKTVDRPKNLIDRALDHCPDKTEAREATCVTEALADGKVSVAALIAMVPGCRVGHSCIYHHKSEDRLGYVAAISEDFVARWAVSFDIGTAAARAADVPVTVAVD